MTYDELQAAFRESEQRVLELERESREAWRRVTELEADRDLWRQCEPERAARVAVVEAARRLNAKSDALTQEDLEIALARLDAEQK